MRSTHIAIFIIVVVLSLGCWWFFTNYSLVPTPTKTGPTVAARRDPYLAAHRFATSMGLPAEGMQSIATVPPDDFAVFLAGERRGFVGKRQDDLVAWVERGGHLLLVLQKDEDDDTWTDETEPILDELLTRLLISAYPIVSGSAETITTGLPRDPGAKVQAEFERKASLSTLEDPLFEIRDGNDNVLVVTVPRGAGRVTAMVDDTWLTSDKIGEYEHATLLWGLLTAPRSQGWWVVRGDRLESFLAILARHGWPALLAFAVLVVLWILRAGARFGPFLAADDPERRSLMEHLDAAGQFLWRCQAQEALLRPMRDRLVREIGRRRPAWSRIRDAEKIERLAELSELSPERVEAALLSRSVPDAAGFVRAVRDLQTLESRL